MFRLVENNIFYRFPAFSCFFNLISFLGLSHKHITFNFKSKITLSSGIQTYSKTGQNFHIHVKITLKRKKRKRHIIKINNLHELFKNELCDYNILFVPSKLIVYFPHSIIIFR